MPRYPWRRSLGKLRPIFEFNPEKSGSIPTGLTGYSFTRATTATTVTESGGVYTLSQVGTGTPRYAEHPTLGTGYLVEPARTNQCTYSEDLTNAAWSKTLCSIDGNSVTAPDGASSTTVDVVADSGTTAQQVYLANTFAAGATCFSVFAKRGNKDFILIRSNFTNNGQYFNLNTGELGSTLASGVSDSGIEDWGNGWYRCWVYLAAGFSSDTALIYTLAAENGSLNSGAGGDDSTVSVYLFGAQAELNPTPTSYIPTTDSSVPRNADVLSYGVPDDPVEGTVVIDFTYANIDHGTQAALFRVDDSGTSDLVYAYFDNTDAAGAQLYPDGNLEMDEVGSTDISDGARHTVSLTWPVNGGALFVDGAQEASDASVSAFTGLDNLDVGHNNGTISHNGFCIHSVKIYDVPGVKK